jgi:hypothetical protein
VPFPQHAHPSDNILRQVIIGEFLTVLYSAFSFLFNWTVCLIKDSSFKLLVHSCSQSDCLSALFPSHSSEISNTVYVYPDFRLKSKLS